MIRLIAYGTVRNLNRRVVGSDRPMASFVLDCDGTALRCVAWGERAEEIPDEGVTVVVAGRMATRHWVTQEGDERATTEVTVQDIEIPGRKTEEIPF